MKTIFASFLLMLVAFTGFAQHDQHEASAMKDWPELSAFHDIISATYHPAEEGKLTPVKTRSGELLKDAHALAHSKVPAPFNNAKVSAAVKKLLAEAQALDAAVKHKQSDAKLTAQVGKVHDAFHHIVDLCNKH
jgi:hypothetical protein